MKKVLIITYYWPPSGGSGVQRWLKFVKYLQNFNIEPIVYTVSNPSTVFFDPTLISEVPDNVVVLKQPILEPYKILSLFNFAKKGKTQAGFLPANDSFLSKIITYIRANYFIPDARKFWIKPSVKYLTKYLKNNPVDIIITTGPPHSLHLIGLKLQEKLNLKWIADFRDPWTHIDYYHKLPLSKASDKKHHSLEKQVVSKANAVLVVGESMKKEFLKFNKNITVITNGYDTFKKSKQQILDKKFTITHIGMMNADRNPKFFWDVIANLIKENKDLANDLCINLVGAIADEITETINLKKLNEYVKIAPYLPHDRVAYFQQKSQVLLIVVNNVPSAKGIITGKVFEYLQAKRPILAIAPTDGDLATIIVDTNSGCVIDFNDKIKLKSEILKLYNLFRENRLEVFSKNIEKYHRKNLTKKLAEVISNTIK